MKSKISILLLAALSVTGLSLADQTRTDVDERLESSTKALHQILNTPDKGIPDEVFKGAKCIAVVPNLIKGGFIIAGQAWARSGHVPIAERTLECTGFLFNQRRKLGSTNRRRIRGPHHVDHEQ